MRWDEIERRDWKLATESIVVKLRWFGIVMGYLLVQTRTGLHNPSAVRAFLALGAGFAALDTAFHRMGEVFLERVPLFISLMEAVFIALLCYHDTGLSSPFRWYFLLSIICTSMRHRRSVAWITCAFDISAYLVLARALGATWDDRSEIEQTIIILAWTTWATASLSGILRDMGGRLVELNIDLERNHRELEKRVAERSDALRASQARVIHQEKMAAFGLLSAGIAHEVGNPLAALSSLIQMLRRRGTDDYTSAKLELAERQLTRISRTIRELVDFSRPASTSKTRVRPSEVVDEAFSILKYHHPTKDRELVNDVDPDLPPLFVVRDHLVQVILNLVINAIDATPKGGRIRISGSCTPDEMTLRVVDNGRGIAIADRARLFRPYFTTKTQGTGLGLFVSRQMIEEAGGRLVHVAPDDDLGACFEITLPASAFATAASLPDPRAHQEAASS